VELVRARKIWEEAYAEVPEVTWLSMGPGTRAISPPVKPIRHMEDFKGLRMYMFPTGGKFMQQFGVVPMSLPYEDVQMALQTGELDGVAWSGITEDYTVGWADVTKYYLTNPISGAWAGSYFANTKKWEALPDHLKTLFRSLWTVRTTTGSIGTGGVKRTTAPRAANWN
jgi:TRAP-type mannitol/chloroaromatic compound transport system substrate-binding protein